MATLLPQILQAFCGERPEKVVATGHLNEEGTDTYVTAAFVFSDNRHDAHGGVAVVAVAVAAAVVAWYVAAAAVVVGA